MLLSHPCESLYMHSEAVYRLASMGSAELSVVPVCGAADGAGGHVVVEVPRLSVYYRVLARRIAVISGLSEEVVRPLISSAFLLHDLGKALVDVQEGYRGCEERRGGSCCALPGCRASAYLHEVFSAAALYGAMTVSEEDGWLPVLAAAVIAVLNHHHAMRSIADERVKKMVLESHSRRRFSDEAAGFVRRVMGVLGGGAARALAELVVGQLGDPVRLAGSLAEDLVGGGGRLSRLIREYRWLPYYADALAGLLSIADYVAASAARSGGLRGFGRRVAVELGIVVREA